jgi:myo-inositol 2-dehydrogenase/D-chiro-inositol 1-dehydrogenase
METVGIALLGLGRAGSFHLESLRALPGARLRWVHDTDAARADVIAREFGARSARAAEEAIGDPEVAAVVIATPTRTHHAYAVAALEAGRAVLCEKPLGTSLAEIDRCFALAQQACRPLLVAFQRRFDPSFAALAEAAHAGEVGDLRFIRSVSRDNPLPSLDYMRTSCGIFHDCLVHDFDLVCHVAGEAPEELFSFGSSFLPEIAAIGDLDNVAVALRFAGGLLATIDVNRQSAYGYDQRLEVFGSRGMLQVENQPRDRVVRSRDDGITRPPVDTSFPSRYREAYQAELACFLACVRGERSVPIDYEDVRRSHRLADAAERSFREGAPVRIDAVASVEVER